jgi:hypothetical protein
MARYVVSGFALVLDLRPKLQDSNPIEALNLGIHPFLNLNDGSSLRKTEKMLSQTFGYATVVTSTAMGCVLTPYLLA